ncbi:hypothetical protein [Nonomuraea sp. B1E8]|uniref:hypothetical protein n=1 Tax=unclassified Nonomuraea TaxID=2593643 RepID=UPI00325D15A6
MPILLRRFTATAITALAVTGFVGVPAQAAAPTKTVTVGCSVRYGFATYTGRVKIFYKGSTWSNSTVTRMQYWLPPTKRYRNNIKVVDFGKRGNTGPVIDDGTVDSYGSDWKPLLIRSYQRRVGKVRVEFIFDRKGKDPRCSRTF